MLARAEVGEARLRGRGETAIPGGNGPVGIAGLLAAERRELGSELGGVGGGHGGHRVRRAERDARHVHDGRDTNFFNMKIPLVAVRTRT